MKLTSMKSTAKMLLAALLFQLGIAVVHAAPVDARAAHGKTALYVYNRTKLEGARVANPIDPKRVATLETWRRNDTAAMTALKALGFAIREADEHAGLDGDKDIDLIVVSESVDAIEVGTKYRTVAIPMVVMENDLLPDLGMTDQKSGRDYGTDDNQRFLWVVNSPHPLAAGLTAGVQNVLADEHFKMNWGKPGLGAITIATLRGEPDKAAIFAYEKGATMNGEALAPARRVSLFIWQDVFENLRPEGQALFRAAALWAVSTPE